MVKDKSLPLCLAEYTCETIATDEERCYYLQPRPTQDQLPPSQRSRSSLNTVCRARNITSEQIITLQDVHIGLGELF